jgi:aminoglycoside phosphotransferase (APT) family kinase protein
VSGINEDEAVVNSINTVTGAGLSVVGRAEKGTQGGAILVSLGDGRRGMVTRFLGSAAHAQQTAEVLADIGRSGIPVPDHYLVVAVRDGVFVVQERLPGRPPDTVTPAVVAAITELNERFSDLLRDRPDVPTVALCLAQSGDPFPRHEVLTAHSHRSRRVLKAVRLIGTLQPEPSSEEDLIHIDLTPDNILFDDTGHITGVVDWNLGVFRGDRHLALVKTRFDLEWHLRGPKPESSCLAAAEQLDSFLATAVPVATLARYWAHRVLYQLHWTLQYGQPHVVEWHLDFAEEKLAAYMP